MLSSRRPVRGAAGIFLIAAAAFAAGAVALCETGPPEIATLAGQSGIVAGPYVQDVTPRAATLMWQTAEPAEARIALSEGDSVRGYTTAGDRCLSELRMERLKPDTAYSYRIEAAGDVGEGSFRTFPALERPIKFLVYGDTRTHADRHAQVVAAMAAETNVDFVLHTGDMVADGRALDQWIPMYFVPAAGLIGRVPVYPVLGNHERDSALYFQYFALPGNERWYSFVVGKVHVLALDSNTDFEIGSAQYKWLLGDLAYRKNAKWKFVVMHHPTFSSGDHAGVDERGVPKEKPMRTAQQLLPYLARRYGIAAVFAGHDHAYERSTLGGTHYIVAGGGGAPTYGEPNAKSNTYRQKFYSGLHYCVVTVAADRASMVVKKPDGKVIDRVEFSRPMEAGDGPSSRTVPRSHL